MILTTCFGVVGLVALGEVAVSEEVGVIKHEVFYFFAGHRRRAVHNLDSKL